MQVKLRSKMSHWPLLVSRIVLDVSSLIFSFSQMLMLQQLKIRHLKKIRETDTGQIKEQDVSLT